MTIKFFAPEWGNTLPFATFCQNVKAAGYDGVEMALPLDPAKKQAVLGTLHEYGLELIGQYWQSFETDLAEHMRNYETYLRNLIEARPVLVNCQTGKDFFSPEQNRQLFALAAQISAETGVKIIHETHRGKSLFAAHVTQHFLTSLPDLRLCLDISHWCTVHESLLADQPEAVALAIAHTDHIHSRVGHPEGPQVNDPRAPEWETTLNTYLAWWDRVVEQHRAAGTQLTINTEFGPTPYMPTQPYSQEPLASQWEVNVFMLNLLKARYA
ncbi:Xylose isomerase domain protein TIM barrel [Fibrella aestuarina BUZ 2]|uniref:Xylose isomerase domain protein TIM barrel n=1 Tax=Fibrella aestuarina BUZ 2 TaxID=1166018 RepID=I0K8D8_9BACT|nr:TIM barrel protein [Fibrella aestuarina]CCH00391.1 Xylose isomerase domain protein TIM barrel [Fibrella aestuarina BUZ 2]